MGPPSHSHQLVHVPSGQLGIGVSSMFCGTSLETPEAERDEAEIRSTTSTCWALCLELEINTSVNRTDRSGGGSWLETVGLMQARSPHCRCVTQVLLPKNLLSPRKLYVGRILELFFPLGKKHCVFLTTFMLKTALNSMKFLQMGTII